MAFGWSPVGLYGLISLYVPLSLMFINNSPLDCYFIVLLSNA